VAISVALSNQNSARPSDLIGPQLTTYTIRDQSSRPTDLARLLQLEFGRPPDPISELRSAVATFVLESGLHWVVPTTIESASLRGKTQSLATPLAGSLSRAEDGFLLEVPELRIYARGTTIADVQASFDDQLQTLLEEFLDAPVSDLAPKSLELRSRLKQIVGEI
jgi:hypothetical protein